MKKIVLIFALFFVPAAVIAEVIPFEHVQSGFSEHQYLKPSYTHNIDFGEQTFYASQVKASHILVGRKSEAEKLRQQILDGEITFEDAAKKYSLCPSREEGGDLGFFPRGVMAGPFEKAAFSLPIGEISQPVETRFGWHLIKVVDKK